MSLSFPTSPSVGQIYNGQWVWNGSAWAAVAGSLGLLVFQGTMNTQNGGHANYTAYDVANAVGCYDTVTTDTQSGYVVATGLYTPKQAGLYLVTASLGVYLSANQWNGMAVCKNKNLADPQSRMQLWANSSGISATVAQAQSMTAVIACNGTTDTISAHGYHNQAFFYSNSQLAGYGAMSGNASMTITKLG